MVMPTRPYGCASIAHMCRTVSRRLIELKALYNANHNHRAAMPGGGGVAVPNGNTASFFGSGGRVGIARTPN